MIKIEHGESSIADKFGQKEEKGTSENLQSRGDLIVSNSYGVGFTGQ